MDRTVFHGLNANTLVLIIADVCMFLVCFLCTVFAMQLIQNETNISYTHLNIFIQFQIVALPLHLFFLAIGLYNLKRQATFLGIAVRVLVASGLHYLFFALLELPVFSFFSPSFFNEFLALNLFVVLTFSRFMIVKYKFHQIFKRNILVLGSQEKADIVEHYLGEKHQRQDLNIVGYWQIEEQSKITPQKIIFKNISLQEFIDTNGIDEIVVAIDVDSDDFPFAELLKIKQEGIEVVDVLDFVEKETGQVVVDHLHPTWFIYQRPPSNRFIDSLHWLFNAMIAIVLGVLTLPIMLITALLIKIEGGLNFPIIYSQERIGLDGKVFAIYKFTSMRLDAEREGACWAQKNDPRVTKVGNFIRKFRIDELPQLYNVIIGDMFFVGPRPERPQFTEDFVATLPFYQQRHNVKPGLTGWAQLNYPYGSSEKDALEKLKFDLYYVKKRNFFLDLLILLKTSEIILFGKGQ